MSKKCMPCLVHSFLKTNRIVFKKLMVGEITQNFSFIQDGDEWFGKFLEIPDSSTVCGHGFSYHGDKSFIIIQKKIIIIKLNRTADSMAFQELSLVLKHLALGI